MCSDSTVTKDLAGYSPKIVTLFCLLSFYTFISAFRFYSPHSRTFWALCHTDAECIICVQQWRSFGNLCISCSAETTHIHDNQFHRLVSLHPKISILLPPSEPPQWCQVWLRDLRHDWKSLYNNTLHSQGGKLTPATCQTLVSFGCWLLRFSRDSLKSPGRFKCWKNTQTK